VCFLARAASSDECLRGKGLVWLIGAVVCVVAATFADLHHWFLPINCHFRRLYSAAGREESTFTFLQVERGTGKVRRHSTTVPRSHMMNERDETTTK